MRHLSLDDGNLVFVTFVRDARNLSQEGIAKMSLGERARLRIGGEDAFGEKEFRYDESVEAERKGYHTFVSPFLSSMLHLYLHFVSGKRNTHAYTHTHTRTETHPLACAYTCVCLTQRCEWSACSCRECRSHLRRGTRTDLACGRIASQDV